MSGKTTLRSFFTLAFIFIISVVKAQPNLPDIVGATDKGINILSWTNQYDGIKSIAVQRSTDSTYNYATLGYIKKLKKGPGAYIDGHPNPGNNWYRLYIVFNSDLTWYSNRFKLFVDSATIAQKGVLPPNDSLQKLAAKVKVDSTTGTPMGKDSLQRTISKLKLSIPETEEVSAYTYVRSQYIFTNPFTGHVNIELPDVVKYQYSLEFFDGSNRKVLEIPRVLTSPVVLDKRNFQRKGLFRFELIKDNKKMETGYITIY